MLSATYEGDPEFLRTTFGPFQQELKKLGWELVRNLYIDYGWEVVEVERARTTAAQLLRLAPDVILAMGTPSVAALQYLNNTVPVVFTVVSEPVAQGFIESLARPGGNVTGFTNLEPTVGSKWLELLKEIAPRVTHVTVIVNPQAFPYSVNFYPNQQRKGGGPSRCAGASRRPDHAPDTPV